MKRFLLVLLLWPSLLCAQGAGPITATTVKATSSAVDAVCVGCPQTTQVPAANSGAKAATITLTQYAAPSVTTDKLYNIAGTLYFNGVTLATGSSISGTTNTIGMFTGVTAMGNSLLTQSGSTVTMAGTLAATLHSGSGASLTNIPTSAVSSGSFVATVSSGTGITSSVTTGNAAATTISLNNTAVTPTAYGSSTAHATFTVDQQGRLTAAANVTPQLTLTSTYFSSLSAANLTAIPAAQITGTYAAPVLSGTVTGTYTIGGTPTFPATVPLTSAANTFTATEQTLTVNANAATSWRIINTNVGASATANIIMDNDVRVSNLTLRSYSNAAGSTLPDISDSVMLRANGVGGLTLSAQHVSGRITGITGGTTRRFTYDENGNYSLGATAANVTDAVAAPTITSGFGTSPSIVGKDYAFIVTIGTGGVATNGVVAFNSTFANAPACSAITDNTSQFLGVISTTTQVTVGAASALGAGNKIHVLCRGF